MITTQAVYDGKVIIPKNKLPMEPNTDLLIYIEDNSSKNSKKKYSNNIKKWLENLANLRKKIKIKGKPLSDIVLEERGDRI